MKKQFESLDGSMLIKYEETDEKKQMLWDAFIEWCKEHDSFYGESFQNDDFQVDSPEFMAKAIDDIVVFEKEWQD